MTVYSPFSAPPRADKPGDSICCCGYRQGLHRWGDEACPNPQWMKSPGFGYAQWHINRYFTPSSGGLPAA